MALTALTLACADKTVRGGIENLWLIESCDVDSFTNAAGTDHEFDTVALSGSFVAFEFFKYSGSHTEETELGDRGQGMINHTLEFFIPKREKAKADTLQTLFDSRFAVAVYETFYDDTRFVVGYDNIVGIKAEMVVQLGGGSGAAITEDNGYLLTLTGQSAETAREWTGTLADLGI